MDVTCRDTKVLGKAAITIRAHVLGWGTVLKSDHRINQNSLMEQILVVVVTHCNDMSNNISPLDQRERCGLIPSSIRTLCSKKLPSV